MKEPINKTMQWTEMQEHPLVGGGYAFWELSMVDIITVFNLGDWYGQFAHTRITESDGLVRVEMFDEQVLCLNTCKYCKRGGSCRDNHPLY